MDEDCTHAWQPIDIQTQETGSQEDGSVLVKDGPWPWSKWKPSPSLVWRTQTRSRSACFICGAVRIGEWQ